MSKSGPVCDAAKGGPGACPSMKRLGAEYVLLKVVGQLMLGTFP